MAVADAKTALTTVALRDLSSVAPRRQLHPAEYDAYHKVMVIAAKIAHDNRRINSKSDMSVDVVAHFVDPSLPLSHVKGVTKSTYGRVHAIIDRCFRDGNKDRKGPDTYHVQITPMYVRGVEKEPFRARTHVINQVHTSMTEAKAKWTHNIALKQLKSVGPGSLQLAVLLRNRVTVRSGELGTKGGGTTTFVEREVQTYRMQLWTISFVRERKNAGEFTVHRIILRCNATPEQQLNARFMTEGLDVIADAFRAIRALFDHESARDKQAEDQRRMILEADEKRRLHEQTLFEERQRMHLTAEAEAENARRLVVEAQLKKMGQTSPTKPLLKLTLLDPTAKITRFSMGPNSILTLLQMEEEDYGSDDPFSPTSSLPSTPVG